MTVLNREQRERGRYFLNSTADRAWRRWMEDLLETCDALEARLPLVVGDENPRLNLAADFECVCKKPFQTQEELHVHIEIGCRAYDKWLRSA